MATIMVRVDEGTKALWVAAAHDERLSLSEWVRRRCELGVGAAAGSESEKGGQPEERAGGESLSTDLMASARRPASTPSSSGCNAYVPRGTRCKLCGKEH